MKPHLDFSEYTHTHSPVSTTNKKLIGKFKDELNSLPLEEFIGLRPKCYSLKYSREVKNNTIVNTDPVEKQTPKGTKQSVKKRSSPRHHHYLTL